MKMNHFIREIIDFIISKVGYVTISEQEIINLQDEYAELMEQRENYLINYYFYENKQTHQNQNLKVVGENYMQDNQNKRPILTLKSPYKKCEICQETMEGVLIKSGSFARKFCHRCSMKM